MSNVLLAKQITRSVRTDLGLPLLCHTCAWTAPFYSAVSRASSIRTCFIIS